jgi:hypothetical protein
LECDVFPFFKQTQQYPVWDEGRSVYAVIPVEEQSCEKIEVPLFEVANRGQLPGPVGLEESTAFDLVSQFVRGRTDSVEPSLRVGCLFPFWICLEKEKFRQVSCRLICGAYDFVLAKFVFNLGMQLKQLPAQQNLWAAGGRDSSKSPVAVADRRCQRPLSATLNGYELHFFCASDWLSVRR